MTPLLTYLLVGFVLHWISLQFFHAPCGKDWRWELASIVLWPVALVAGILLGNRK